MKIFIMTVTFLIVAIISSICQAEEFMTFDNPAWTREDMLIRRAMISGPTKLPRRQYADNKEYIFKDERSTKDREFMEAVAKINDKDKYIGH